MFNPKYVLCAMVLVQTYYCLDANQSCLFMSGTFESQFICSAQVHFKFFIFLVDFANIIKNLDFFLNNNKSFMNINLVQNTTKTRLLNHVLSNIYYYNLCKRKIHPLILSLVYTKTYEYFMQVRLKSCNYYISSSHILPKIYSVF